MSEYVLNGNVPTITNLKISIGDNEIALDENTPELTPSGSISLIVSIIGNGSITVVDESSNTVVDPLYTVSFNTYSLSNSKYSISATANASYEFSEWDLGSNSSLFTTNGNYLTLDLIKLTSESLIDSTNGPIIEITAKFVESSQEPETPTTYKLTITGMPDNAWEGISDYYVTRTSETFVFDRRNQTLDSIPEGTQINVLIHKKDDVSTLYEYTGASSLSYVIDSNKIIDLSADFKKTHIETNPDTYTVTVTSNDLPHLTLTLVSPARVSLTDNVFSNVISGSILVFNATADDGYLIESISSLDNVDIDASDLDGTRQVVLKGITADIVVNVALKAESSQPTYELDLEHSITKNYIFKIQYKNSENKIWVKWNPTLYQYKLS